MFILRINAQALHYAVPNYKVQSAYLFQAWVNISLRPANTPAIEFI